MPVRRFIEVYKDHPADDLPADVVALLTPAERSAFADVPGTFRALSARCKLPSLKRLLRACSTAQFVAMELDAYDDAPLRVYFRLVLRASSPAIRLPDKATNLRRLPEPLRRVYASLGGVQDDQFGYVGGLCPANLVTRMDQMPYWLSEDQRVDPAACVEFLTSFGGDSYGFHSNSGRAVQYWHEDGKITEIGSLTKLLNRYFDGLTKGQKL